MKFFVIINGEHVEEDVFHLPMRLYPMMRDTFVREHFPNWCHECGLDCYCHPYDEQGRKYCTVLYHDAVVPDWAIEDLS